MKQGLEVRTGACDDFRQVYTYKMSHPSPNHTILDFILSLPADIRENIAVMPVLLVSENFEARPGDDYIELVTQLLLPPESRKRHRAAVLCAGVLDYHLSEVKGLSSEDYLQLARKFPSEFFQKSVLIADDRNAKFAKACEDWQELRSSTLCHQAIHRDYIASPV